MNFGLDRNEPSRADKAKNKIRHNEEVKSLLDNNLIATTQNFNDLPIVHTGCDTYASIYPEFKDLMMNKTLDEVVDHLLSCTPERKWTMDNGQDVHLILTGGEPLLGWQKFYVELFNHPLMQDLKNVTIETNTTQKLRDDFVEFALQQEHIHFTFSCSPKLSISGESWEAAIKPDIAKSYYNLPRSSVYFKFVVADRDDVLEAERAVVEYRAKGIECPVYLMPLGGRSEEYKLNVGEVANICLEKGWRFSPRLHIDLFGNAWAT